MEKLDKLVLEYRDLNKKKSDAEKALKAALEPTVARMNALKLFFKEYMNKQGVKSLSLDTGTVYKMTKSTVTVRDKTAFFDWLNDKNMWEYADIRASKKNIVQEAEETGAIPDGVALNQFIDVGFRKPTTT